MCPASITGAVSQAQRCVLLFAVVVLATSPVYTDDQGGSSTQSATGARTASTAAASATDAPAVVATPADYMIGSDDVLTIYIWREKDLSGDVVVRPDGKITLPLINDIQAAGLTPEQLRGNVSAAAGRFVQDPRVTVAVKQINSRKVYITGQVGKPAPYPLLGPMTVLQLIATAGGLLEYADAGNIVVMRTEDGRPVGYRFNYDEVRNQRNLKQNLELKPGDTVIVP
jgi:polysaccharide export outer membrane protein